MNENGNVRPDIPRGSHPIEQHCYIVPTNPMVGALKKIVEWIDAGCVGASIFGFPRMGKTRALWFATAFLTASNEKFKIKGLEWFAPYLPIPVVSVEWNDQPRPNEDTFLGDMLRMAGHAEWRAGKAQDKRWRLTEYLREKAEGNPHRRLVFFVDEAHWLDKQHYKWLVGLHNQLDKLHVRVIFIFVGQHQLASRRNMLVVAGEHQIVGRFMLHSLEYKGLSTKEEVRACLRAYDDQTEFPKDSGCSYTRYFFTFAFDSGWRLTDEIDNVWKAFDEVRQANPSLQYIPMQCFSMAVDHVLSRHSQLTETKPQLTSDIWKKAVEIAGYAQLGTLFPEPSR